MNSARSRVKASHDDLTALARIRLAAIEEFAERGFAHATVRAIAERAGVSAPLVLHHYGSKAGLRKACDDYVTETIRDSKHRALTTGSVPTIKAYLVEHPELRPFFAYMKRVLVEGGPLAHALFDTMVSDTTAYLAEGVEAGMIRPSADPEARAAITASFGLGALLFDSFIARHLGGESVLDDAVSDRYVAALYEFYSHGMLTGRLATEAEAQARRIAQESTAARTGRAPSTDPSRSESSVGPASDDSLPIDGSEAS